MKHSEITLSIREIVLFGILGALTFGAKYVMSFLPNIEPVSLCVMLYAVVFGKKWVYPEATSVEEFLGHLSIVAGSSQLPPISVCHFKPYGGLHT